LDVGLKHLSSFRDGIRARNRLFARLDLQMSSAPLVASNAHVEGSGTAEPKMVSVSNMSPPPMLVSLRSKSIERSSSRGRLPRLNASSSKNSSADARFVKEYVLGAPAPTVIVKTIFCAVSNATEVQGRGVSPFRQR